MSPQESEKKALGRLSAFGLKKTWQTAFLLPSSWDDMTCVLSDFSQPLLDGDPYLVCGRLESKPKVKFDSGRNSKVPRLNGSLLDGQGNRIGFSQFGDTRKLEEQLKKAGNQTVYLYGTISLSGSRIFLRNAELVHPAWAGRLRPKYPGKVRVIGPETARSRILALLKEALPNAAFWLEEVLKEVGPPEELIRIAGFHDGTSLEDILYKAHLPRNFQEGVKAQRGLERLAALGVILQAKAVKPAAKAFSQIDAGCWRPRASSIPFPLTDEQQVAVEGMLDGLRSHTALHGILTGDVGTGKTATYALACAAVADRAGRAAVLLPNQVLAEQIANDLRSWWPDISIHTITGADKGEIPDASILVGTTALLHRLSGSDWVPDLVVVDEQQKLSREQREVMLVEGQTNLIEVTATPIPRTQALLRYGIIKVWKLTRPHTPKQIDTRIWYSFEKPDLFARIRQTLTAGDQVLVVYPLREQDEKNSSGRQDSGAQSVEEAFVQWNRIFPDKVRHCHGQMPPDQKNAAIADLKEDRAQILIATSVVEVGINLPRLRRIVIVRPDRYGLTQLHQLRGRVARTGGQGWCDLYLPIEVKPATLERLEVLERTQDGFEVAEWDLKLRGAGDMGRDSTKQSGADETFLFGRGVKIEILDEMINLVMKKASPGAEQKPELLGEAKLKRNHEPGYQTHTSVAPRQVKKPAVNF
ncbi:helicase-related protein [Geoalkalibacter subterraneus]|uniref:helicase-related protein n=1 Tax=Geoalkalibacter subterraneus TaxID=483547 RepID=UPI000694AF79|nr:helicase-related protein [Geoalkalibacter subterraneus]